MSQRKISDLDVLQVIRNGDTIEDYSDDRPFPSRLILGWVGDRPIHVVAAHNAEEKETIVITAYEPNEEEWDDGFARRRR